MTRTQPPGRAGVIRGSVPPADGLNSIGDWQTTLGFVPQPPDLATPQNNLTDDPSRQSGWITVTRKKVRNIEKRVPVHQVFRPTHESIDRIRVNSRAQELEVIVICTQQETATQTLWARITRACKEGDIAKRVVKVQRVE